VGGRLAALLCSLAVVAGCAAAHPSAARRAAEQQYVDLVHQRASDIGKYQTSGQLVKLGYAACDGYRANASNLQIADVLEGSGARNLPPGELGAVMSSAASDLCPVYHDRFPNPAQGG
jgi:hypothetical protein